VIVLDTNVVSELMARTPHPTVIRVLDALPAPPALTVITVAEIRFGVAVLPKGVRQRRLSEAAERMFAALGASRLLPFDEPAAALYSQIAAGRRSAGRPISQFDAMIAAICTVHSATLLTRNVKDFAGTGLRVQDPWRED
jgi:predicted nucleic acid-binding protein